MIRRHNSRRRSQGAYRTSPPSAPGTSDFEQDVKTAKAAVKAGSLQPTSKINDYFYKFARKASDVVGSPWSFITSIILIIGWALSGPLFGFTDTWQLVINTATTIVTFLMVFLIQNTQNRDARAIHLKLDELLHAVKGARNRLINLQDLSEEELNRLEKEFRRVRSKAPPEPCEKKQEHPE